MYSFSPTTGPGLQYAPPDETDNAGWIRANWRRYLELWPKILGVQHSAAVITATSDPSSSRHQEARLVVDAAAALGRIHTATVREVEKYSGYLGLGAVAIVPAALALAALVAIIAWSFRKYDALEVTLAAVEAGTITPGQAQELLEEAGPMPDIGVLGGITGGVLLGAAVAVGLLIYFGNLSGAGISRKKNPDLILLGMNPDPIWSRDVLQLDYIHEENGQPYTHEFKPGVRMQSLEDGSVRLYHPRRRIWREF
ncbi:hypothetical protein LCGC14_1635880 [marine sediment metagenome]|uniref:Uncharacterized protein n=1 Tax=marine sediment metagenome TaxID=412755 RepID=A0A0F9INH0_9ZZZZ